MKKVILYHVDHNELDDILSEMLTDGKEIQTITRTTNFRDGKLNGKPMATYIIIYSNNRLKTKK